MLDSKTAHRRPMISEPARLTMRVPHGKVGGNMRYDQPETRYLSSEPNAPPVITEINFNISLKLLLNQGKVILYKIE